jgi:hypothetical protein
MPCPPPLPSPDAALARALARANLKRMVTGGRKAAQGSVAYREAKLALLRVLTHQSMETTDAAARKVEDALILAKNSLREGVGDSPAD